MADQTAIDLAASAAKTAILAKPYTLADLREGLARPQAKVALETADADE